MTEILRIMNENPPDTTSTYFVSNRSGVSNEMWQDYKTTLLNAGLIRPGNVADTLIITDKGRRFLSLATQVADMLEPVFLHNYSLPRRKVAPTVS
jgi:predicted transcriptional regulator